MALGKDRSFLLRKNQARAGRKSHVGTEGGPGSHCHRDPVISHEATWGVFLFRPPAPRVRGATVLGPVGGERTRWPHRGPALLLSEGPDAGREGAGCAHSVKGNHSVSRLVLRSGRGCAVVSVCPPIAASHFSLLPVPTCHSELASQQAASPVQNVTLWWPRR